MAKATKDKKERGDRMSKRARFTSTKGAKLDVLLKQTGKGYRTSVTLKKAPKKEGEKVKGERGMVVQHDQLADAEKAFDALCSDAKKNGWTGKQMVQRSTFDAMPKADA